jgi:hypothetical protein
MPDYDLETGAQHLSASSNQTAFSYEESWDTFLTEYVIFYINRISPFASNHGFMTL